MSTTEIKEKQMEYIVTIDKMLDGTEEMTITNKATNTMSNNIIGVSADDCIESCGKIIRRHYNRNKK